MVLVVWLESDSTKIFRTFVTDNNNNNNNNMKLDITIFEFEILLSEFKYVEILDMFDECAEFRDELEYMLTLLHEDKTNTEFSIPKIAFIEDRLEYIYKNLNTLSSALNFLEDKTIKKVQVYGEKISQCLN